MRESNFSDSNSIRFSEVSQNKNEIEESIVMQKRVQTIVKKDDEEINLSSVNNSVVSFQSINNQENTNNLKTLKKEDFKDNNDSHIKDMIKKSTQIGNKMNYMITETEKRKNQLYLRIDKEKTEKKKYTVYEISKIIDNKKEIFCYRRYENFSKFYEALKIRYPHYIFPKLSIKNIMTKVYDDPVFLEQRKKELEFFLNEIYSHEVIGKGEEIKKFLNDAEFDAYYFKSLLKIFDYPETLQKINENQGMINKGIQGISSLYNYFIGNKSQIEERKGTKQIFEKTKNLGEKKAKYKSVLTEIKNIYEAFKEENEEKKGMVNNFIFLQNEKNEENNPDKKKFNDLIEIYQNYDFKKSESLLKVFEEKIIDPLNFCILYLNGEEKAVKRYKDFLEQYNNVINYKNQEKDNNRIILEQHNIKQDIDNYEDNLLKEIDRIENKTNKEFEIIIHILIITLKDSTEEFNELFKNSNFING